jgi:transposase InsO family protein
MLGYDTSGTCWTAWRFANFMNHKPLTYALARVSDPWTARQSRQLSYVAEYTSDIRHIDGAANVVADTLSRPPRHAAVERPPSAATCVKAPSGSQVVALQGGKLNSSPPSLPGMAAGVADVQPAAGISFHRMAANQVSCPSTLQAAKSSALSVRTVQVEGASLLCDVARGITRPLVPLADRPAVFHAIHNVAHPGIRATKRMGTARFGWKGVGRDVAAMCRECQQCKRGKVHKQPAAPLQAIPVPARKFSHVHLDLVGPLPASSDGHLYLLTIIDRSTRWFEAVPLQNMEASTCVDAFIANWVARFGVPETVTTDRGAQFTYALWSSACTSLGIKHVLTTAYHPQSNGMVERVHRQLKDALRAPGAGPAWHSHLPWVLLGLRAASKEDSAVSSAELITGTPLVLPGQLLHVPDPPHVDVPPPPMRPASYTEAANTRLAHLAQAEHVYMRVGGQQKPLAVPYAGPYLVVSKGAKTFTIQVGQRQEIVSVDRLKPHTGLGPVSPAEAASRGRPPRMPAAPSVQPAPS